MNETRFGSGLTLETIFDDFVLYGNSLPSICDDMLARFFICHQICPTFCQKHPGHKNNVTSAKSSKWCTTWLKYAVHSSRRAACPDTGSTGSSRRVKISCTYDKNDHAGAGYWENGILGVSWKFSTSSKCWFACIYFILITSHTSLMYAYLYVL